MSNDELTVLISGLAIAQAKTDAQIAKTDAALDKLAQAHAETETLIEKNSIENAKLQAEMRAENKATGIFIKNLTKDIAGVSKSMGKDCESFFVSSLRENPVLGGIRFDYVDANVSRKQVGGIEIEIDAFLENGSSIVLVEIKTTVRDKSLKQLDKIIEAFPKFFPSFKDYKIYGAIAGKVFAQDLQQKALKKGYFVLTQQGKHLEISTPQECA